MAVKKKITEKAIEKAILTYLNYLPSCFAWKNNNGGVFDPARGKFRANKNPHVFNGVSDILGIYKGRMLAIEVKKPGGKATDSQQDFINRIKKMGGVAGVCTSVDEARELIKTSGV